MSTEQERKDFEAWYVTDCAKHDFEITVEEIIKLRGPHGDYRERAAHHGKWIGWKARAALQSQSTDTERLDWLDGVAHCADWMEDEPTKRVIRAHDGAEFTGDTWREAIDHARSIEGDGE